METGSAVPNMLADAVDVPQCPRRAAWPADRVAAHHLTPEAWMRPFRRAADRTRMQELETVIGEGTRLLKATPATPTGQLDVAVDAARKAVLERLLILARNRPPNKSRRSV